MKKKTKHDKFMEFWDSKTTRNILTIWAPIFGFPAVVAVAETMNVASRGRFPGLKQNVAGLYSAALIANLAAQVGQALSPIAVEAVKAAVVPSGYP